MSSEAATIAAPEKIQRRSKLPRKSELDSRSVAIPQKEKLEMPPIDEEVERESLVITPETPLIKDDFDKLAFAEEAITILIHRSGEKFAPRTTDFVGVNGKPAEMLFKNGWIPMGYLPRGISIVTKRKVVEVLARSKQDHVTTTVVERDNEDPKNFVERSTVSTTSFSVLHDPNPMGGEWLSQLLRQQG